MPTSPTINSLRRPILSMKAIAISVASTFTPPIAQSVTRARCLDDFLEVVVGCFRNGLASRADFGLTVESDSEQATRDANGVLRLTADKPLRIRVKADRDCRVSVWWTDPAGQVQRLFPNKYETDDRVRAGQVLAALDPTTTSSTLATAEAERVRAIRGDEVERVGRIAERL